MFSSKAAAKGVQESARSSESVEVSECEQFGITITDEIEDDWTRRGVPTEFLELLRKEEEEEASISSKEEAMPLLIRSAALRCLSQLLQRSIGSQAGWFKAVLMFDSYTTKVDLRIELLPATCACLMQAIMKHDYKACQSLELTFLQFWTQEFSAWLSAAGYVVPDMTEQLLRKHEVHVMKTLKWRVARCCVEQWNLTFMVRFGFLAGSEWNRTIRGLEMKVLVLARALVMSQTAPASLPHGCICLGLLCLAMVEAGILPLDVLCPQGISLGVWTDMYIKSQPDGVAPTFKLQERQSMRIMEMLKISTNANTFELQDASFRVATALGVMLQGIRETHETHDGQQRTCLQRKTQMEHHSM